MKKITFLVIIILSILSCAVKNENRISPRTTVSEILASSGAKISISYGQPQIKGRIIGKTIEPNEGQVWRAGADEATVFETSKDIKVNGQVLPAGKYSFFTLKNNDSWTVIFNKTWNQWGAYDYKEKDDVLRVKVKSQSNQFTEKLAYTINNDGHINILWGDSKVGVLIE